MRTSVSRRALLRGTAGLTALSGLSPILLSFDAAAAETINLTLPWIPEGEVAFMYAARKQGWPRANFRRIRIFFARVDRLCCPLVIASEAGDGRAEQGLGVRIEIRATPIETHNVKRVRQIRTDCVLVGPPELRHHQAEPDLAIAS
jgi:hypothetical protein